MKDGGIIIENGGADLFLHCDALQKSIRKHLRRAQKKLSELLFVFFIMAPTENSGASSVRYSLHTSER